MGKQEILTGLDLEIFNPQTVLAEAKTTQVTGKWPESVNLYTEVLAFGYSEHLIPALTGRGVAYRMLNQYTAAEADFHIALDHSISIDNIDGQLDSLGGLIDLARTGDRDPRYKRGKDLTTALLWRDEAALVLTRVPKPRLSEVNTLIQFGLLDMEFGYAAETTDKAGANQHYQEALATYSQAETDCQTLLEQNPDNPDLLNRQARVFTVKGVAHHKLEQTDLAIRYQKQAYEIYLSLGDIRGIGNAALSLGDIYTELSNKELALEAYMKAIIASQDEKGEIIDPTILKGAANRIASLKKMSDNG